jgi:hypothetical protein
MQDIGILLEKSFTMISAISLAINGVVVTVLATIVIPRYLREPVTGKFQGFKEIALLHIYLGFGLFTAIAVVPRYGYSFESYIRILSTALIPFGGALVFFWLTDLAGWDKSRQTRG